MLTRPRSARLRRPFCTLFSLAAVAALCTSLANAATCAVTSTDDSAGAATTAGTLRYCATSTAFSTVDLSTLPPLSIITLTGTLFASSSVTSLHGPANGGVTISGGSTTQAILFQNSGSVDHLVFQNVVIASPLNLAVAEVTSSGITSSSNAALLTSGSVSLTDTTVTGNAGGGVQQVFGGTITQSTVYGNASFDVESAAGTTETLINSIGGQIQNPGGQITKTNSYVGTGAMLGPLQLNGSLFPTMLPLPGSPAIGIGGTTTADQRGFPGKNPGDAGAVQTHYITVTALTDAASTTTCTGTSACMLRQAINTANAALGGDITFGSLASAAAPGTITLTSALPNITSLVNMAGPGANALSISGGGHYAILNVPAGGGLAFNGLTATAGVGDIYVGALNSYGLLTLTQSAVTATTNGPGIGDAADGGSSTAATVVTSSTISGNSAPAEGGGIFAEAALRLVDSTISGNGSGIRGGGVSTYAGTQIFGTTIAMNAVSGPAVEDGGLAGNTNHLYIANSVIEGNIENVIGSYSPFYPDTFPGLPTAAAT